MDEQTAIARLQQGDIGGLEVLVKLYQLKALRAADLITRDQQRAQDIVQNAFVRVYHKIHQFDTARPFGPWFLRIVINDAVKAVERNREVSLETPLDVSANGLTLGDVLPDLTPTPDLLVEQAELREQVWTALGELPADQRAVIVMHYYLEFDVQAMAEALDSPAGTIKWRLHRAREKLRTQLAALYISPIAPSEEHHV